MTEPGQWVPVIRHDILSWTRNELSLRQPTDATAGNTAPGLGYDEIHHRATQKPLRHKTRLFVRQFLNAQVQIGNMLIRETFDLCAGPGVVVPETKRSTWTSLVVYTRKFDSVRETPESGLYEQQAEGEAQHIIERIPQSVNVPLSENCIVRIAGLYLCKPGGRLSTGSEPAARCHNLITTAFPTSRWLVFRRRSRHGP